MREGLLRLCLRAILVAWALAAGPAWSADMAGTLVIPGTGDSQSVLRAMIPLFQAHYPGATLVIPDSVGSSGGIKAVVDGDAVLARVARPLKDSERLAGLEYRLFARSPVVFAANLPPDSKASLTMARIVDLYDGSIRDYADLGGGPGKVYVLMRERGDSSLAVLRREVPGFADIKDPVGKVYYTTPETVQALVDHPGALAYVPLAAVRGKGLTVLAVDGVEPTAANVRSGAYPLAVPLALIHKGEPGPLARAFIEFVTGAEAARGMKRFGCVPIQGVKP